MCLPSPASLARRTSSTLVTSDSAPSAPGILQRGDDLRHADDLRLGHTWAPSWWLGLAKRERNVHVSVVLHSGVNVHLDFHPGVSLNFGTFVTLGPHPQ
jgi:hypothetical protein